MHDLSNTGLPENAIKKIQHIFSLYPEIERAYLYGSRAKGNFQSGSDIDLTIVGEELSTSRMLSIETELDNLLLPWEIDLCRYHTIENPELIEHVKRVGIEFYARKKAYERT